MQEEMRSLGLKAFWDKDTKQAFWMQEFFPKMEGTSGNMGWHGVLLLRGLGSRGPKDEVFFVEEPEA